MLDQNSLYISNDISDVRDAIASGVTIIALVDNADEYRYLDCVIMGVLLPPYESLSAEIDGDLQTSANIYYSFLLSKMDVLANILAAMYKGKKFLIFVPKDESMNFSFVNVFRTFFMNVFGISMGVPGDNECPICLISNEDIFLANRADVLFTNGLINMVDYCALMPTTIPPSENACCVMMRNINYRFENMMQCINYCHQYIAASKQQTNGMFSPVFRVKPL